MQTLWRDFRYAFRVLAKSPGFAAVALLTLGLGIGADTAVFSVVNAVLLRPLPFPNPDRLALVWATDANRGLHRATAPPPDFLDWREQNHVFAELSAWRVWFYNLTGGNQPEQVWGVRTSANFFKLLGVRAGLGRSFLPEEEQSGHDQVVILSHGLWERRFAADPSLIGKTIAIDDKPFTVVGILPARFSLFGTARQYDLWMPLVFEQNELRRDNPSVIVFGRLKPGVTLAQAQAEMDTIARRLAQEYPATNKGVGVHIVSMHDSPLRELGPALALLFAAVGFVLLIACANVANLLLARAAGRQKEIAIRVALGAGRLRLFRQLLTESVLLGILGGTFGLLLAFAALRAFPAVVPPSTVYGQIPHMDWIGINLPVLGFALLVSLLTGIVFGSVPAFRASKMDLNETLKEGVRNSTAGRDGRRIRAALVVAEVALSLVLLVGAGLLIRSFRSLLAENPGIHVENVLTMQVWLPEFGYPGSQEVTAFFRQALDRVRGLPGVESASVINFLPLSGWADFCDFSIEGRPQPATGETFNAQYRVISTDYFRTMGIPLKQGRELTRADWEQTAGVAMINETLAHRYWPHGNPIGQRIRLDFPPSNTPWRPKALDMWLTIIGIVGDVREWEWGDKKFGQIYLSYLQYPSRVMRLTVRTSVAPLGLAPAVRHALLAVDKNQPVTEVKTMEQFLSDAVSTRHLNMLMLTIFASLAVVLSAVGIYGVISYIVAESTHDIGIRMALGAQPRDIFRLVVGQGLRLALVGVAMGLAAALGLSRFLASQLFGVRATDPATLAGTTLLLAGIALLACYLPARRATKVDPMTALRYE